MSIRFHKGPSIITLFHDSSSPLSKQVLQLLTNHNVRRSAVHQPPHGSSPTSQHQQQNQQASSAESPHHGESCVVEAQGGDSGGVGGGGMEYLRAASADLPTSLPIELEVVDRKRNPPTPDQMRSIIDYLTHDPTDASAGKPTDPNDAKYTTSGFNLTEHERRKKMLRQHLANAGVGTSSSSANSTSSSSEDSAGMPKIKDGPLVVNWDEGFATTSLEGVQHMLKRIEQESLSKSSNDKNSGGGGCIIC